MIRDRWCAAHVVLAVIAVTGLWNGSTPAEPAWEDQRWILARLENGEVDTLRALLDSIPETEPAHQFLRGVFEPDGEMARFYYDQVVALYPNSLVEAMALERLWQYHWAKGDGEQAEKYWGFLHRRHPDYPGSKVRPEFGRTGGLSELLDAEASALQEGEPVVAGEWTVQLGAFSNEAGARKVAGDAARFGRVRFLKKKTRGRELTVVQLGRFSGKREAETVRKRIENATGIRCQVVSVDK